MKWVFKTSLSRLKVQNKFKNDRNETAYPSQNVFVKILLLPLDASRFIRTWL